MTCNEIENSPLLTYSGRKGKLFLLFHKGNEFTSPLKLAPGFSQIDRGGLFVDSEKKEEI